MKTIAMYKNAVSFVFNFYPHAAEAGDGRKAVCPLEKIIDFRGSFGEGAKHDTAVRDGFVAGNRKLSPQTAAFSEFHNIYTPLINS